MSKRNTYNTEFKVAAVAGFSMPVVITKSC